MALQMIILMLPVIVFASNFSIKSEGENVDVNLNVSGGPRCDEASSSSSPGGTTKSDVINSIVRKDIVDVNLDTLMEHISELLKRIEEPPHQEPSTPKKFTWPDVPALSLGTDLTKLKELLSSGLKVVSELKDIISGPVKTLLKGLGKASVATAGLLVVAYTLERFDDISDNKEKCRNLLKEMCFVANVVKIFKEKSKENTEGMQEVIEEATALIIEGAIMCCTQITSSPWARFFKASKDKDDLSDIRVKLNVMYLQINIDIGFRVLAALESKRKSPLSKGYPTHAVGIDESVKEVLDLLECASKQKAVAVILHGFGGMGKTTLGDAVFSQVGGCKYSKVRLFEDTKSTPVVLELQKQILKDLTEAGETIPDIRTHEDGRRELGKRLEEVQAFLYVDNVLDADVFRKLLPHDMDTAKNVRVLLTARDENVKLACPKSSTKPKIYKMKGIPYQEAMLILKKEIDEGSITEAHFRDIIQICGEIPLMLTLIARVIGRADNKKDAYSTLMKQKDKWAASEHFKEMRYAFAYDALPAYCKEPFLDICSFFKGWDWETVSDIVGKNELKMLESRALVTKTTDGVASVHNVISTLALHMSKKVRLTFTSAREFNEYFEGEDTKVIKGIQGIWVSDNKDAAVSDNKDIISTSTLRLMHNSLRVLHLGNSTKVDGSCITKFEKLLFFKAKITHLPFPVSKLNQLRYLSYEPIDLKLSEVPPTLVHVDFNGRFHSRAFQISSIDLQRLPDLRILRLMNFSNFTKFEDVDEVLGNQVKGLQELSLQELSLSFCMPIKKLPESILNLRSLLILKMYCCISLIELPKNFGSLSSLQELTLGYCKKLEQLPDSFVELSSLRVLDLKGCESLRELPDDFDNLTNLEVLILKRCRKLDTCGNDYGPFCQYLDLSYCDSLKDRGTLNRILYMRTLQLVHIVGSKMLCKEWAHIQRRFDYRSQRIKVISEQDLSMSKSLKEDIENNILLKFDSLLSNGRGEAFNLSILPPNTVILVICDLCPCPYDGFPWGLIEETIDDMQINFKIIYIGRRFDMLPTKVKDRIFVGHLPEACAVHEVKDEDRWYIRMVLGNGESDEYRPSWRLLSDSELEEFVVDNCTKYVRLKQLVETSQESNRELLRELFAPEGHETAPVFQKNGSSEQKIACGVDQLKGKTVFIEMRPADLCYGIRLPSLKEMYDVVKEKLDLEIISISAVEPSNGFDVNKQFLKDDPWFVLQNSLTRVVKIFLAKQCEWKEADDHERWYSSINWIIEPNGRITIYKPSMFCTDMGEVVKILFHHLENISWGPTNYPTIHEKIEELRTKKWKQLKSMSNLEFLFSHLESGSDQVKGLMSQGNMICVYSGYDRYNVIPYIQDIMEELRYGIYIIHIPEYKERYSYVGNIERFWLTDTIYKDYYCPLQKTTVMEAMPSFLNLSEHEALNFWRCLIHLKKEINETDYSDNQLSELKSLSDSFPLDDMFIAFMDQDGKMIAASTETTMADYGQDYAKDEIKELIKLMMRDFQGRGKEIHDADSSVSGGLTKNMQMSAAMDNDLDRLSEFTVELLKEKQLYLLLKFKKVAKEWSPKVTWPTSSGFCMLKEVLSEGSHVDWVKDIVSRHPQENENEMELAKTVAESLVEGIEEANWAVACFLAIADVLERIETVSNNRNHWLYLLSVKLNLAEEHFSQKPGLWTQKKRRATKSIFLVSMMCCSEIDPIKFAWLGPKTPMHREDLYYRARFQGEGDSESEGEGEGAEASSTAEGEGEGACSVRDNVYLQCLLSPFLSCSTSATGEEE